MGSDGIGGGRDVDERDVPTDDAGAEAFGLLTRSVRKAVGLDQAVFSRACGISARTLGKIEDGKRTGDATPALKIARWMKRNEVRAGVEGDRVHLSFPSALLRGKGAP